jgi:hypothetical protein
VVPEVRSPKRAYTNLSGSLKCHKGETYQTHIVVLSHFVAETRRGSESSKRLGLWYLSGPHITPGLAPIIEGYTQ